MGYVHRTWTSVKMMSVLKSVQIHKVHTNVPAIQVSPKTVQFVMISMNAPQKITRAASK